MPSDDAEYEAYLAYVEEGKYTSTGPSRRTNLFHIIGDILDAVSSPPVHQQARTNVKKRRASARNRQNQLRKANKHRRARGSKR